jgi:hypothetical protein
MKELVAIKYQGVWNEIFNPRFPGGINTDDEQTCINHIISKYKQFSKYNFVVEGNEMFAVVPDNIKLSSINDQG